VQGGVGALGAEVPVPPRDSEISPTELVKKFLHSVGHGVSLISYFGFNTSPDTVDYYPIDNGDPYAFFGVQRLQYSSFRTPDQLLIPPTFRALLNVQDALDQPVLEYAYVRDEMVEGYDYTLADKTVSVRWVQPYVQNIDLSADWDVGQDPACVVYDLEGFELPTGVVSVGLDPVFLVCGG